MSNLGDLQKQLSQILAGAQAQGYKIEQIIPKEMRVHFQDIAELKTAREFIREMEKHEKDLQAENEELLAKLKEKEQEIEDQPADFRALKVDLQVAHRMIEFQKEISEVSTRRAKRAEQNFNKAARDQIASDELAAKIVRLQREIEQQQSTIRNLQEENQRAAEVFEALRAQDAETIVAKDAELADMLSHSSQVETESEQFNETFTTLIDSLETENCSSAALLNDKTLLLNKMETLYDVVVGEITPLDNFYARTLDMLQIFQGLFQTLSNPNPAAMATLPQDLDSLMTTASQDLSYYQDLYTSLSGTGSVAEQEVCRKLHSIFTSANAMLMVFSVIKVDAERFLGRLSSEPSTWASMKAKLGLSSTGTSKRFSVA
ncbi:PspA-IM30 domain containing protein [Pyrenophora tritici-repentis]|uniref:Trichoplein multi-domain protein n=2 Tax=Pyrenophora tritici-repentis TaxID=45151 RepID=A0A2W1G1P1_9PLEO|nr:uncharacterized protein PTRG_10513 [Pyrenophora tritici-repentis Pt-1C-BFP]KAA8621164.1 hypothetical protein PtrV1_05665 [Pyrenophora tritici-repentis]EDU43563.1 predicted protein [Pyrenophora tritici-repentis Pt-1C-BFP]KAF7450406.1 hypothetical protein A1F99_050220 [Pyrenophora tritici-repentis]KAF7573011.1 Trichoplein multi-domain protein [Pyrenophora tritici-repentis]KAG9381369.1 hypothetical protein A1F94_008689 [Pyrenophora tritici-repentis]